VTFGAGVLAVLLLACAGTAAGATWVVDDDGGADRRGMQVAEAAGVGAGAEWHVYPGGSIQATVNAASPGDTIYVPEGEYCENVNVDKCVTLIGGGADVVTVRAADAGDNVFDVTADWVNMSEFTVTGATGYTSGICLDNVDHCNISGNNASNNHYGGIYLYSSSNNTIMSNNASNNYVGISMDFSSNSMIIGNSVLNNSRWGIRLAYPINNTLSNNIAKFNNEEGIFVGDGFENTISNNICESNECGIGLIDIYIDGCDDIDIFASNNKITNNTCKNNSYGIGLTGCFNNTISSNLCESNEGGISLGDAINNTLYHNNFINNTYGNAYDPCTNQWDSGSESNYWSDYREKYPGAVEIDDSGIWDTPYDIPGGTSTDRFPLMHPWTGDTP